MEAAKMQRMETQNSWRTKKGMETRDPGESSHMVRRPLKQECAEATMSSKNAVPTRVK